MLIVTSAALLAGAQAPPENWLVRLRTERAGQADPVAIVARQQEFGESLAVSLYRERSPDGGRWAWRARREHRTGDQVTVDWASTPGCATLPQAAVTFERVALPHIEIGGSSTDAPRPRMGPSHRLHLVWMRAWDDDNAPVEVTLSSLGTGPGAHLFEQVSGLLDGCWSSGDPPARSG